MSSILFPPLPTETAQAAEAVFGREHPYLKLGAALGKIWTGLNLSRLGSSDNFLSRLFYPYSLVTILQYWEYLTDRQMAQATRTRLDMKYALHLPLNFPGIKPDTLCEFRQHVLASPAAAEVLDEMSQSLSAFAQRDNPAQGADEIMTSICLPSRADAILETMDIALETIAALDPGWLKIHTLPHWFRRYHLKIGHRKLPSCPEEVEAIIESVGNDGWHLLKAIKTTDAQLLAQLPEIITLQREWQRQFAIEENSLKFRRAHCLICVSEMQAIKNTITRKETGELVHPKVSPPSGGQGREPGK